MADESRGVRSEPGQSVPDPTPSVLFVGLEPGVRPALEDALRESGLQILWADSGDEALLALRGTVTDLIVIGLDPDRRPLEVLGRIVHEHPDVRIVLVTRDGTVDEVIRRVERGDVAVLHGPASATDLRDAVERGLRRRARGAGTTEVYDRHLDRARESLLAREFARALEHVERAIDVDDGRPEAFNLLAVIEEVRGDRTAAQTHWRVALVLDPSYAPARQNLTRTTRWPRPGGAPVLG